MMNKILLVLLFVYTTNCFSQNFWEHTNGPYAPGTVTSIRVAKDGRIFVGIDGVGLYCSTDVGRSFSYLSGVLSNTSIGQIVIDQKGNIFAGDNGPTRKGLFRSSDNGISWTQVLPSHYIEALASGANGYIFAGTRDNGIFRSSDYGNSWTQVNSISTVKMVSSLAINSNGELFVSGWESDMFSSTHSLRSIDNGETWRSLAIPPKDYITKFVFAPNGYIVAAFNSDSMGFLISSDNGSTWICHNFYEHSYYYKPVVVFDSITGSLYAYFFSQLLRSTDFGNSWTVISSINSSSYKQLSLDINKGGYIFAGNDNGFKYSSDNGSNWIQSDGGFLASDVSNLTLLPNGKLYTGTNNGVFILANDKVSWIKDDSACAGSFIVTNSGNYLLADGKMHLSTNEGKTWKIYFDNAIELAKSSSGEIFCGGYVVSGIHAGSGSAIWSSTDNGNSWKGVYYNKGSGGSIKTLAVTFHDIILASGDNERLIRSTNFGNSWAPSLNGLPAYLLVNLIRVSKAGIVFLCSDNGMFRSTDDGLSWNAINNGLNSMNVTSIAINNEGTVFVGTMGGGVYESPDNGDHWTAVNSGLYDGAVSSLLCDSSGYLYAATKNLGVYKSIGATTAVEKVQNIVPRIYSLYQNYPNPFNPSTTISYALPKSSHVIIKVYDILGREVSVLVNEEKNAGSYRMEFNANKLASGIYLYRMQAGNFTETKKLILMK